MSVHIRRKERLIRPLQVSDLPLLMAIEVRAYTHPWTEGIFRDCLRTGYICWALTVDEIFTGYAVTSVAVGECHLLNLTIDPAAQGQGLGRYLLRQVLQRAIESGADIAFLEVRPSNLTARHLYESEGFNEIGRRKNYYPSGKRQREDALLMAKKL